MVQTLVLFTALVECSNVSTLAGVGLESESRESFASHHVENNSPEVQQPVANEAAVQVSKAL